MNEIECLINKIYENKQINEYLKSMQNKPEDYLKLFITEEDISDIRKITQQSVPNASDEKVFISAILIILFIEAKEINQKVKSIKDSSYDDDTLPYLEDSCFDLLNDAKEVYEMISKINYILMTQNQLMNILENLKNDIVFLEDILLQISNYFRLYGKRTNFGQISKADKDESISTKK